MMTTFLGHLRLSAAPHLAPRLATALLACRGFSPLLARFSSAFSPWWWTHTDVRWDIANLVRAAFDPCRLRALRPARPTAGIHAACGMRSAASVRALHFTGAACVLLTTTQHG